MSDKGEPQIKTQAPRAAPPAPKAPDTAHARAHDDADEPVVDPEAVDHSMDEEQKLGWDQAPKDPDEMPRHNTRHPRQLGQGGTLTPEQAREKFDRDDVDAER